MTTCLEHEVQGPLGAHARPAPPRPARLPGPLPCALVLWPGTSSLWSLF